MKGFYLLISLLLALLCGVSCKEECTLDCQNGAKCVNNDPTYGNNNAGYRCECATGFEGSTCGVKTINRFTGLYAGGGFCSGNSALSFSVSELSASDGKNFTIGPIDANYYTKIDTPIGGKNVVKYKFLVANQSASIDTTGNGTSTSLSFSGSGYFLGDSTMVLSLKFTQIGGGNSLCTSQFQRQ